MDFFQYTSGAGSLIFGRIDRENRLSYRLGDQLTKYHIRGTFEEVFTGVARTHIHSFHLKLIY